MDEGFLFNHNRCVGCGACSAACTIENGWSYHPRMMYTFNSIALPSLPVVNLSLACNHCKKAVCMEGCPTSAFTREAATGAVIIDDSRCIGCKYCMWNCPYDAPKYVESLKVIGKCNLCFPGLTEGVKPACSTACPTGALRYGRLDGPDSAEIIPWFPGKKLEPALQLTGSANAPLIILPENAFETEPEIFLNKAPRASVEWSLLAFSFLTILSVANILSALITGTFPDRLQLLSLISAAGLISLLHLGKKRRAWRAVINLRHSVLSREIGLFLLYSLLAALTVILKIPILLMLSAIAGLLLSLAIDAVYINTDNRKSVFLHSGQSFITVLLIVSFITAQVLPFIFIASVKIASSIWLSERNRYDSLKFITRFARIALLMITGVSMISKISYPETDLIILFLAGELLDRILFYLDFRPLNINNIKP